MATTITKKITRSILHYLYQPSSYDPEQQRIEAERYMRMQLDEWMHDEQGNDSSGFQYGQAASFDPRL